jgi:hypothetical protein
MRQMEALLKRPPFAVELLLVSDSFVFFFFFQRFPGCIVMYYSRKLGCRVSWFVEWAFLSCVL